MEHLSQQQIQVFFEELLERLEAKYYPINVQIQPDIHAEINNCFNNVARKVAKSGGSVCYGWALLPQMHILEAEKHAIWKTADGHYIDITPRTLPITMIQFVIDNDFEYTGQLVGNIRVNITGNRVVDDWIFVCEAIDTLYCSYSKRIDDNNVAMPEKIAPYLKGLETFVKNFEPYIMAGGEPNALCFCGKPLFYKDCHCAGIRDIIAKDLENIAKDNPQ
jgi:hypothetical protein